ncbi:MAG: hypothetical protein CMA65_03035 [Euryarchaeota archaeon]|nr:hypothetical protein [Euryarchaeota archaeon]
MNAQWKRAILTSLILMFSSLAGCLGGEEESDDKESYGIVMVSTWHVGEIVKAIAGNDVELEYMSQDNIPVHDYEPTAEDLIRLQSADVFFYHGLGLEPWVNATLESLGDNAPTAVQVHAMPTGQETLDYESVLVSDLCELVSEGPYLTATLGMDHDDAPELHDEYSAVKLSFPEDMHHDEDGHDEDGHDEDGHDEDGHEEDGHEGHNHIEAEETMVNPAGCPTDTAISIYHLEEGEYVLEFEDEHMEEFTMAVLKMGGGHAHHDHGAHGDEHGDEHGVCHDMRTHENHDEYETEDACEDAGYLWMEEEHSSEHGVCHDEDTHENHDEYKTEEACEDAGHHWMEGDHDDMTPEGAMEMADTNNDGNLSWDEIWTMVTSEDDHDGHHDGDHERTFHCSSTVGGTPDTEIEFSKVNDGTEDCGDGSDEPQDFDGDGTFDNWFDCMGGSNVSMELVNDGNMDCPRGDDEAQDHGDREGMEWTCLDFVNYSHVPSDGNFTSVYNSSGLDSSICGTAYDGTNHTFGTDTFTMPEKVMTHECVLEHNNTTHCETTIIESNSTGLWETHHTDNATHCHGNYDTATSMCLEWLGELSMNDSKAFNVVEGDNTTTVYYQYNQDTQSGILMVPDNHHDEHHDEHHDDREEEFEMRYFMHFFNTSDADNNQLLDMSELTNFIASIDAMEDDGAMSSEMMIVMYDMDGDSELSVVEFTDMFRMGDDDGHDEDHDRDRDEDHGNHSADTEAMLKAMFDSMDANNDGKLNAEELANLMEMMRDDHDAAVATLHVRAEGDYGFALPNDVTMHIIASGGHDEHAGHDDHDDHAGEERDAHDDHASEERDDHDDHAGEERDDHDDHGDEESMNYDPHSWLDPLAFNAQSAVVLEALIAAFPEGQEDFEDNAAAYSTLLTGLDVSYAAAFGTDGVCQEKKVSANHNAYSYIAVRYGIQFETVHGLDPEGEPSPADVAEVIDFIKEEDISVIFIEEYTDESSVKSIVDETGVSVKTLYTMEMAPKDINDDYMSLMGKNLQNLMDGMSCSVTTGE